MGKRWLGSGRPWLQIEVVDATLGHTPGMRFMEADDMSGKNKAPKDGVYLLNGGRFRVKEGDLLPHGAQFVAVARKEKDSASLRGGKKTETTAGEGPQEELGVEPSVGESEATPLASEGPIDLTKASRDDLNNVLKELDPESDPESLQNKDEVIKAINAAKAEKNKPHFSTLASEGPILIN